MAYQRAIKFKTKSKVSKTRTGRCKIIRGHAYITFGIHEKDNEMKAQYKLEPRYDKNGEIYPSIQDEFGNNAQLLSYLEAGNNGIYKSGRMKYRPINLPSRPLLASTIFYDTEYMNRNVIQYAKSNERKFLEKIANQLQTDVKAVAYNENFIVNNAPTTVKRKGYDYPFKYSNELLNSIKAEVHKKDLRSKNIKDTRKYVKKEK